ncbi:hypothetical protein A0J48_006915 [Sphaerospermopsis aphanizomenoides BCCUSP55]|uniref:hypothetical protein n=1 Tax=Sphaerospermopsis aphanizomenoides TaxID=459663 RepID=UPI001908EEED|nr:hypothetical protein [Sphaerospermopsis aphanizomenoides]MBK1987267.1 hypothetical protein [Sphaerospermopsis aphanizomenoides BCCUSP55]
MEKGTFDYSKEGINYTLSWKRQLDITGFFVKMVLFQRINCLTDIPLWVRICEMTYAQYEEWKKLDPSVIPLSFLKENDIELFEEDYDIT